MVPKLDLLQLSQYIVVLALCQTEEFFLGSMVGTEVLPGLILIVVVVAKVGINTVPIAEQHDTDGKRTPSSSVQLVAEALDGAALTQQATRRSMGAHTCKKERIPHTSIVEPYQNHRL